MKKNSFSKQHLLSKFFIRNIFKLLIELFGKLYSRFATTELLHLSRLKLTGMAFMLVNRPHLNNSKITLLN